MKSKDFVELGRGMSSHGNETPSLAPQRDGRSPIWNDLGNVDHVDLTLQDIIEGCDRGRHFEPPKGKISVHTTPDTPATQALVKDLLSHGCIAELPQGTKPSFNVSVRPKPHSKKSLAIADCRHLILQSKTAPRKISLPDIQSLLLLQGDASDLFMTKLDITNAYWSTFLPKSLPQNFSFCVGSKTFALLSLPYGWNLSPTIFQKKLGKLIEDVLGKFDCVMWGQYLDDVLLLARGFQDLAYIAQLLVAEITRMGWIVSSSKSVTVPTKRLTWLGKDIAIKVDGVHVDASKRLW